MTCRVNFIPANLTRHQQEQLACLQTILHQAGSLLIALSGGIDSSLLATVGARCSVHPVLTVTICGPFQPRSETEAAARLAGQLALPHHRLEIDQLADPDLRNNPPQRCYLCKRILFSRLQSLAATEGLGLVVDGSNADDRSLHRPGRRALRELGVRSPLDEAGLGKQDIRELARALGMPNWNRPSNSCLATRFPHNTPLTRDALSRVEQAEEAICALGFALCRVRSRGSAVRLELDPAHLDAAGREPLRSRLLAVLQAAGFACHDLNPVAYTPTPSRHQEHSHG